MKKFLDMLLSATARVAGAFKKVQPKGALGVAWVWLSWAIVGFLTSLYNFFISPKVWPAVAVWGGVIATVAFNVGQRHPERALAVPQVNATDLSVCRTQQARTDATLDQCRAEVLGLKGRLAKAETELAEKPKTVVRYRTRASEKAPDGSSFSINWPKF